MRKQLSNQEQLNMSESTNHGAQALPNAAFTALGGNVFRASELTRGPWNVEHQHAGPPSPWPVRHWKLRLLRTDCCTWRA